MPDTVISINSNHDCLHAIARVLWDCLPPEKYPSGLRTYEFMWKYKVSRRVYDQLLYLIKRLDFSNRHVLLHDIDGYPRGSTNVARVISLIISEWYKREACGLDGDGAMDIFSFNHPISARDVWEAAGFEEALLHRARRANLRQTAMCVLGGFPLVYVLGAGNRFETLINKLSLDEDDVAEDNSWDQLFDDHNTVFSGSLRGGSCKEYVDALWQYMETEDESCLPFNEEDLQDHKFQTFCTLLTNGYGEKLQKDFFKETHHFFTTDKDYNLQAQIRVQVGFKKDNHILYASQLEKIDSGMDLSKVDKIAFFLRAVYSDGSTDKSSSRYYRREGNGRNDFVSVGLAPLCIEYDIFNIERIELLSLDTVNNAEHKLRSFKVGSFLELYESQTAYCWTSRKQSTARKALLLDYAFFQEFPGLSPIEKRSEDMTAERPIWNWLHLSESLVLKDVYNDSFPFKCGNSQPLQVSFTYSGIEQNLHLKDGWIDFFSQDEQGQIRLLCGEVDSHGRSLNLSVLSMKEGKIKKTDDFYLEYKELDSYRYVEWTSASCPKQGFLTIRVSTKAWDKLPYVANVYYIPSRNPVERNLVENTISFDGVSGVSMYDAVSGSYIPLDGGVFHDSIPDKTVEDVPDTVVFRVGNEVAYVKFEVYRAFWMQELIQYGKRPKRYITRETRTIPVLFHQQFRIRTINNEGSQVTQLDRLNNLVTCQFQSGFLSSPEQLCKPIPINSAVDVYVYRSMIIRGHLLIANVSPHHIGDYHFYFWNGSIDSAPVTLPSTYNNETRELALNCSSCQAERGVIFQSLKDCRPYNYYRPFYIRSDGRINPGILPFYNRPGVMYPYNSELVLFCYNLFREHKVYAAVFSPLIELHGRQKWQKDVLEYALEKANYSLTKEDVLQLNRLCSEVGFEWMLLPRRYILEIVSHSGTREAACVLSLRRLFEASQLVKENNDNNRYEQYYFKRIFVDNDDYFNRAKSIDTVFRTTRYRSRVDARTFVDYLRGEIRYSGDEVVLFIKRITAYDEYIHLFHDVFYQYVIK